MSTLDAVRTTLCLPHDASAVDVLKAAQDEIDRLSEAALRAKNVQQRNGAKKKLAELKPLMTPLEVEVNLSGFEESIEQDGKGSAAQRAAGRVQAQKLGAQIAALPTGEEKEVFEQWFADLNAKLASTPRPWPTPLTPAPATTSPPIPPPAVDTPRSPVVSPAIRPAVAIPAPPILPPPPPPPLLDPAAELRAAMATLEAKAKARALPETAFLLRGQQTLAEKVASLAEGPARADLEHRGEMLATTLRLQEEWRHLVEAVDLLEQGAKRPDGDMALLLREGERLTAKISQLGAAPENATLSQRVEMVNNALAGRRDRGEIEIALQRCSVAVEKGPNLPSITADLDALTARIASLADATARAAFTLRVEALRKGLIQRRNEEKISAAIDSVRRSCSALDASPGPARVALDSVTSEVQSLPHGPARTHFEKQLGECSGLIAALEIKSAPPPQKAVVLRLEPIKGRASPSARPLIFVARDRFSIGRKPDKEAPRADFLTPSAETRISRVHVTFFIRQGKIHVLAGEEGKPSTNPALLDDSPLSSTPVAASFDTERRIDLTGVLTLGVKLVPSVTPYGPPLSEEQLGISGGATVVMPAISGCLRLRPQGEDMLPSMSVWVFTDASIGSAPTCAISLPQAKLASEQARIHYWQKSFWLETLRAGTAVELGGKPLLAGASQPLRAEQELRLGDGVYSVHLS